MVHATVTQAVGKRVVGKQNILPLLRDAAEDDRVVRVVIDKEKRRYTGVLLAVSGKNNNEAAVMNITNQRTGENRVLVATSTILAFQIIEVGPAPDSIVGQQQSTEASG